MRVPGEPGVIEECPLHGHRIDSSGPCAVEELKDPEAVSPRPTLQETEHASPSVFSSCPRTMNSQYSSVPESSQTGVLTISVATMVNPFSVMRTGMSHPLVVEFQSTPADGYASHSSTHRVNFVPTTSRTPRGMHFR